VAQRARDVDRATAGHDNACHQPPTAPLLMPSKVACIVPPMRINDGEVHRVADFVVRHLAKQGFVHLKVPEKQLAERISRLLIDDLHEEEALEQEAEKVAEKLGRQALGMDRHKLIEGIKARLAKERGFAL
jgi:hypothetical protein